MMIDDILWKEKNHKEEKTTECARAVRQIVIRTSNRGIPYVFSCFYVCFYKRILSSKEGAKGIRPARHG